MKRFLASLLRAPRRLDPDLETRKVAVEGHPSGQNFPPNYEPLRRLGGRQAAVYLARHVRSSAQVVVKTLQTKGSDSDMQHRAQADRLRREAGILSQCSHENLVACVEAGELSQPPNPVPYFVMPFVSGVNLFEHIGTHGPLPQAKAVVVLGQLCAALSALHASGWLHCDLAPTDVMLIVDAGVGAVDRIKLIDLGIARPVAATALADSQPGEYGSIQGSPSFMSPEACRGSSQLTIQSDV